MFLIEYDENTFVDGEQVNWVRVQKDKIQFTLSGNSHVLYVAVEYQKIFVNNLGAIDGNMAAVEKCYHSLINKVG